MDALALLQLKKKNQKEEENRLKQDERNLATSSGTSSLLEQRRLNRMFGFPSEPTAVFSISRGVSAAVWWTYQDNLEYILGWEVLRYRKDPNQNPFKPPEWQYKGSHSFSKLEKLQVVLDDLATSQEYRFTVKAINSKGKSLESAPSNVILIEQMLPSGWFRFYDDRIHRPYYASIKSNRSSWIRPENDPFFLDDSVYVNFEPRELKHLKSLFVEDIAHFQSINVDQFLDILREVGEKGNKSYVKKLFLTYADDLKLTEWAQFMEVINHFKLQHLNRRPLASCFILHLIFQRNKVQRVLPPNRDKLGLNWEVEFNTFAQRLFYRNNLTHECTWQMPDEVKFHLPVSLEKKLLTIFDFYEIEELKRSFSLLDVDNSGDLSEHEIKLLLRSIGIKINERKLRKLMKAIDTNHNGTVEFDEFCWMMYEIKKKDRKQSEQLEGSRTNSSRSLSLSSDDGMKGKFSFGSIIQGVNVAAKNGTVLRRTSFSQSSVDDSVDGTSNSRPFFSYFVFLPRRTSKIVATHAGEFEAISSNNPPINSATDQAFNSRQSSYRSVDSSEESSILEMRLDSSHHKFTVRRKSSFRDLSDDTRDAGSESTMKHSAHCFCGCRRY